MICHTHHLSSFLQPTEPSDYCDKETFIELSQMTIDELINDCVDDVPFHLQVMVTLRQRSPSTQKRLYDIKKISSIIAVARNKTSSSNIQGRLDVCCHFSTTIVHLYFIYKSILDSLPSSNIRESPMITFIPCTVPYYASQDKKFVVWNYGSNERVNSYLDEVREEFEDACKRGLLLSLQFNESKRVSSTKKSPVIHTGYTTNNAHDYKTSRQTQFGHTEPSLITSHIDGRSVECLKSFGRAMCLSNRLFRDSPICFKNDNNGSTTMKRFSDEFMSLFNLDDSGNDRRVVAHFRHHATTTFCNVFIRPHLDTENDTSQNYSGAVCMNICLKRSSKFPMSEQFGLWLDSLGYTEYFPMCLVNYGRKGCGVASLRPDWQEHRLLSDKQSKLYNLRKAIADSIMDTKSDCCYLNTFELMKGIHFNDVTASIRRYNKRQFSMIKKIRKGSTKELYIGFSGSMGSDLVTEVKEVGEVLKSNTMDRLKFDWKYECKSDKPSNKVPIVPDPSTTYQGPVISFTAAYDIMVSNVIDVNS